MVDRRRLPGVLTGALAAVVLSACGRGDDRFAAALTGAIEEVPGVESVELEVRTGAEFQSNLIGEVHLASGGGTSPTEVFDEVIQAVARTSAEDGAHDHLNVQWLIGRSGGQEITVFDLEPALVRDEPVPIRVLYERYGVS